MKIVVDIGQIRTNIKQLISSKLFNWIDIRNNFYGFGINLIEDLIKMDNIGFYTDDLKIALKIRNVNKTVPIILTKINDIDYIYDVIMNNIILSVDDAEIMDEILNANIEDKINIALRIDIKNFEDGITLREYKKIKEQLKDNKYIDITNVYTICNNEKNNDLDIFKSVIENANISSFIIGTNKDYTSSGFISKEIFNGAVKYKITVSKCYKLNKGDIFIDTKIRKECYGLRIKLLNAESFNIKEVLVEDNKYKAILANDYTLYLIGKKPVKNGKSIDITNFIWQKHHVNWPIYYKLNEKNINLTVFG